MKKLFFKPYDCFNVKHTKQGYNLFLDVVKEKKPDLDFFHNIDLHRSYQYMEEKTEVFVLEDSKGNVIAMGGYTQTPVGLGYIALGSFSVIPTYRLKGAGSQMVYEVERKIVSIMRDYKQPACTLILSCFDESVGFWQKSGYREIERRNLDHLMIKNLW